MELFLRHRGPYLPTRKWFVLLASTTVCALLLIAPASAARAPSHEQSAATHSARHESVSAGSMTPSYVARVRAQFRGIPPSFDLTSAPLSTTTHYRSAQRLTALALLTAVPRAIKADGVYLSAPANGSSWQWVTGGYLTFSWSEDWYCPGCDGVVVVVVGTDPGLSNVAYSGGGVCPASQSPSCPTSVNVSLNPGTYYWAVGLQLGTNPIHVSDEWSFTIVGASPPPAPVPPPTAPPPTSPPPTTPPAPVPPPTPAVTFDDGPTLPTISGPSPGVSRKDPAYTHDAFVVSERHATAAYCWDGTDWGQLVQAPPGEIVLGVVDFKGHATEVSLAPNVCARLDILRYLNKRPAPNAWLANSVDALAHESLHTDGFRNEAMTECVAMQLTGFTSTLLGTKASYGRALANVLWSNYSVANKPPGYWSSRCHNGGPWDISAKSNSWPTP